MAKILLIDDSPEIGALVESGLIAHEIHHAQSQAEAEALLKDADFDLLLIDVCLPQGSGFDLCLKLTQDARYGKVPKILLTALDEASQKVYGFNCGADDYVTKPFHPVELKARVDRFLQRRTQPETAGVQIYGRFEFNLEFQKCWRLDGAVKTDLDLTPTEFRLFLTLVKSAGHVLSRKALEKVGWESQGAVIELRGIDTHIAHLRRKLGPLRKQIVSVYGKGYSFAATGTASAAADPSKKAS